MIPKVTAKGHWWLAASSRQHVCSGITLSHDSAPEQPRLGALGLLAFPKTKTTFEREEISDCQWDSGKYDGAADGHWENCVRSQGVSFEGDWGVIVLYTMFLVSCIFLHKCLFFILHGAILSGQTLVYTLYVVCIYISCIYDRCICVIHYM